MKKFITLGALEKSLIFPAISAFFAMAQASSVVPPPLPTGSNMVKQHGGMNQDEVKRSQRAHHHNKHHKKNYMRDDTLDDVSWDQKDDEPSNRSGRPPNAPKAR